MTPDDDHRFGFEGDSSGLTEHLRDAHGIQSPYPQPPIDTPGWVHLDNLHRAAHQQEAPTRHQKWLAKLRVGDPVLVVEHTDTIIGGGASRIIGLDIVTHLKANSKAVTVNGRGYSRLTGISKHARGGAYWFTIIEPGSPESDRLQHRLRIREAKTRITDRLHHCDDLDALTQIEAILNPGSTS